jgi:uncharacterized protein
MFEFDKAVVEKLLVSDNGFRRLYEKHCSLNAKVDKASAGDEPMPEVELETLKKEKLAIRDRLREMIQAHNTKH